MIPFVRILRTGKTNLCDRNQNIVCRNWLKVKPGDFGSESFHWDGSFMCLYVCQNVLNYKFIISAFHCISVLVIKKEKEMVGRIQIKSSNIMNFAYSVLKLDNST